MGDDKPGLREGGALLTRQVSKAMTAIAALQVI